MPLHATESMSRGADVCQIYFSQYGGLNATPSSAGHPEHNSTSGKGTNKLLRFYLTCKLWWHCGAALFLKSVKIQATLLQKSLACAEEPRLS